MQGQTLGRSVARKERLTDWDGNGKEQEPGMEEEGARRHWRWLYVLSTYISV